MVLQIFAQEISINYKYRRVVKGYFVKDTLFKDEDFIGSLDP